MSCDIIELHDFYNSALGRAAERSIKSCLDSLWPDLTHQTILGVGYTLPYLIHRMHQSERTLFFTLAQQGIMAWPPGESCLSALVDEEDLPLPDQSVDRILMVHALEDSRHTREVLRDLWRILKPDGRIIIMAPNRRGLWARSDNTPLGHSKPYTMTQLNTLMKEALFTPIQQKRCLYMLPSQATAAIAVRPFMEKVCSKFLQKFSGMICIEATKQIYAVPPIKQRRKVPTQVATSIS